MAMKLSIIIPVYNVRQFLGECIDSILAQTMQDFELILIDDGSTDGSADIVSDYASRFPGKIKSMRVKNGGQGRARNIGLGIACGEYVGFIDSDDWIEPDMYEKLLRRAEETDAQIVFCDFMAHYANGSTEYLPGKLHDNKMSASGSCCNKLFRRDLIGELHYPEGLWYEDFCFSAILLMRAERVEYIREPLYIYRCGQISTMHNTNAKKNLDMLSIMEIIADAMKKEGHENDFEFLLINHVLLDSINRLACVDTLEAKQSIVKLREYIKAYIPALSASEAFRKESGRRRLIMYLNYHGLESVSRTIFKMLKKIR